MVVYDHPHEGSNKAVAPFQKTRHHVADYTPQYFDELVQRLDAIEENARSYFVDQQANAKVNLIIGQKSYQSLKRLDKVEAQHKRMQGTLDYLFQQRHEELLEKIHKKEEEKQEHKKPGSALRKLLGIGKKPKK